MNISFNTLEVRESLNLIKDLKPGKNPDSILSTVRIVGNNHKINIIGTNLKNNIITTHSNYEFANFDICFNFQELVNAVKSIDTNMFFIDDTTWNVLSYDLKESYKIKTMSAEQFPDIPLTTEYKTTLYNNDFQQCLKNNLPCVSDDETRYFLGGIFFENENDSTSINMVSTDGRRLNYNAIRSLEDNYTFKDSIVEPTLLKTFSKLKLDSSCCSISFDTKMSIEFEYKFFKVQFQCYIIDGQFPQYRRITSCDRGTYIELNVKDTLKAAKKVSKFTDKKSHRSYIKSSDSNLVISDDNEKVSIQLSEYNTNDLYIALNIKYLIDCLSNTTNEYVKIHFQEGTMPVFIMHDDGLTMIQPMQRD